MSLSLTVLDRFIQRISLTFGLFAQVSDSGPQCPLVHFLAVLFANILFLYARLKNGRIMLYPSASVRPSVRPSVCKLFRFRVTPPTVYVQLS